MNRKSEMSTMSYDDFLFCAIISSWRSLVVCG
uniref:Uncharacterized protein n=1 Tax=Rhizophora mucronata TaxID=61149 RepID=A0A2P2NNC5_RHIMU